MKLCVFPNDPLRSYLEKGEMKPRYFNPKNVFDEIHVISLFDSDENEENVRELVGNATLKIHIIGKTNLINIRFKKKRLVELIRNIKPNVIRSYNPLLQGWLATQVGKELGIPVVISLMADYDRDLRYFAKKNKNFKNYFKLQYSKRFLESFSIRNANEIIIVYDFIRDYAKKMGAKNINLIYNRIDLSKFSPQLTPTFHESKPIILCVGRLMSEKNQECLIKAVKDLDIILLLVGDGPQYNKLNDLVKELKIKNKVRFERSVPNKEINRYYTAAKIFALPIKYGGFAIPVLEAAASGIPVILASHDADPNPELTKDFALLVDNNPESFKEAIQKVLSNEKLQREMIQNGLKTVRKINSEIIEEKEKEFYLKVTKKN
ncbi:MAG: hypothetical protein NPMRTH1_1050024 [Nitrosopumilales archaeon]|nr:MAG: hypothetical protein NPMRTH1_1050024 [Nitrosopumilales archaeon]